MKPHSRIARTCCPDSRIGVNRKCGSEALTPLLLIKCAAGPLSFESASGSHSSYQGIEDGFESGIGDFAQDDIPLGDTGAMRYAVAESQGRSTKSAWWVFPSGPLRSLDEERISEGAFHESDTWRGSVLRDGPDTRHVICGGQSEYLVAFKGYKLHHPLTTSPRSIQSWYEIDSDSARLSRNLRMMLDRVGSEGRITFSSTDNTLLRPRRPPRPSRKKTA